MDSKDGQHKRKRGEDSDNEIVGYLVLIGEPGGSASIVGLMHDTEAEAYQAAVASVVKDYDDDDDVKAIIATPGLSEPQMLEKLSEYMTKTANAPFNVSVSECRRRKRVRA